MNGVYLTQKQIKGLTGYERPSKQIAWMKKYGLRFFVAADGRPRLLKSDLENKENQRHNTPNFTHLKKAG